ncbi:hypothetical protein J2045_002361 [Peteryoungia aggregata LMG 23059]|uniref:Uncharacterized protein n=1 Tax=Peteryoungia aggregata LMG 23059 TaxID=1368425 RepID=A0ABU0G7M2_9HYPH|nr:hypothetical protein [Peteryoungia aggregata]MDQ0421325.1 hypothetical protein [Peteryoungia aggregata LMG 23059]
MIEVVRLQRWLPYAALFLAGTLFSVAVFLGWMRFGGAIFLSLIESGLAYCF